MGTNLRYYNTFYSGVLQTSSPLIVFPGQEVKRPLYCTSRIKMTPVNLREAKGFPGRIIRCSAPNFNDDTWIQRMGLILDLRSSLERRSAEVEITRSTSLATFCLVDDELTPFDAESFQRVLHGNSKSLSPTTSNPRTVVLRINVLAPSVLHTYTMSRWMTPREREQASSYAASGDKKSMLSLFRSLFKMRGGLEGLNEAILECGKRELCSALQAMTLYWEHSAKKDRSSSVRPIVLHCVQGKDRTGMLVMLCQSILGLPDSDIIDCYHQSDPSYGVRVSSQLTYHSFSRAPIEVIEATLLFIRERYQTVCPGYLNHIGFDAYWRQRFLSSLSQLPRASRL